VATVDVDIESRLTELSDNAFAAFCDDIAAMFDASVESEQKDVRMGTVADLKKSFKKQAAIHLIQATGKFDGTFQLMFDHGGLFILSGVIVMLPEKKILEDVRRGSATDAENLTDATREVGNLLVGSWDRIFREECEEHEHFLKTATVIGQPWDAPEEIALSADDELLIATYKMTVDSYPAFTCAAVFPKTILDGAQGGQAAPEPVVEEPSPPPAQERSTVEEPPRTQETPTAEEPPQAKEVPQAKDAPPPAEPPQAKETSRPDSVDVGQRSAIPEDLTSIVNTVVGDVDEEPPTENRSTRHDVRHDVDDVERDPIERMLVDVSNPVVDTGLTELLSIPARKIMDTDVVWCAPEDTVQDVLDAMQQHNSGYALIGTDNVLEGLVSNSSILAAISPYLRPMFAKWRRPEDDATLGIKIKWMMSRPVRTVKPETPLGSMIESMRRFGGRCLPVADGQGKVLGIVTVFDILVSVLGADHAFSWQGKPPQAPPLLI